MFEAIKKNKAIAQVLLYIFLAAVFLVQNHFNHGIYQIHSRIDDAIPFIPAFVTGYFLWYFLLIGVGVYFLIHSKDDLYKTYCSINICMVVALTIYLIFPNYLALRPPHYAPDFFSQWVRMLQSIDNPVGVCPSLHVATSVSLFTGIAGSQCFKHKKAVKAFAFLAVSFIISSTVLIKQHSVIDVAFGLLLGLIAYLYVYVYGFKSKNP